MKKRRKKKRCYVNLLANLWAHVDQGYGSIQNMMKLVVRGQLKGGMAPIRCWLRFYIIFLDWLDQK
jgi:uncharacterized phage infection (PIP) family protein YhgE